VSKKEEKEMRCALVVQKIKKINQLRGKLTPLVF